MRYMHTFNRRLEQVRAAANLSLSDVAELCEVDESLVAAWESRDATQRRFPGVVQLMNLCLRTGTPLESLLDLDDEAVEGQLELPGLAFSNGDDLSQAVNQLEKEIGRLQPASQLSEEENRLLRRFRKSSAENRRMVMQLLER